MLDCIPSDLDRDTWVKIMAAVKSELGDAGFELVDTWSQDASNYDARAVRDTYRSINANGGITIGTLYHYARQHGYAGSPSSQPTMAELAERKRQAQQSELERQQLREKAAQTARKVYGSATAISPNHLYLTRKQVTPVPTLREIKQTELATIIGYSPKADGNRLNGRILVVPFMIDGRISTIEMIDEKGLKSALAKGQKSGAYWTSRQLVKDELHILIAEGVATALSATEATGLPAVSAGDCHNLKKVALVLRELYPDAILTFLADLGNGEADAEQAAISVNGKLARPDFGPDRPDGYTDFNDLAILHGHALVKGLIESASMQQVPLSEYYLLDAAKKLTPESSTDNISKIIESGQHLFPIAKQRFHEAIKSATKVPLKVLCAEQKCLSKGNNDDLLDHLVIARKAIMLLEAQNILCTGPHIWEWDQERGVWRVVDDRKIKKVVHKVCEDLIPGGVFGGLVNGTMDILKTEIFADAHHWNVNQESINVSNGELILAPDGWQIGPHVREHFRTTQLPVKYDPQASAPLFSQYLNDVFLGEEDGKEKAQAILEMIGYSMVSHARHEKFILLIGNGANGKSVLLAVVRALIGPVNCSGVQPSQFGNQFQRAHLHHKLANIVSELKEGEKMDDDALKASVSGEVSTVAQKFKDPFDMEPYCTCWFGANHLPHTNDFSNAMFRRAIIVPFNRQFVPGVDADPLLKDKLSTPDELSGILNLALDAYAKALKCGIFTEPKSCLQAKQEWRLETDQAAQFVEDRVSWVPGSGVLSSVVFNAYSEWVEENGIKRPLNKKNLTQRLERLGAKPGKGTGGVRLIYGLSLRPQHRGMRGASGACFDITSNNSINPFAKREANSKCNKSEEVPDVAPLAPLKPLSPSNPEKEDEDVEYF